LARAVAQGSACRLFKEPVRFYWFMQPGNAGCDDGDVSATRGSRCWHLQPERSAKPGSCGSHLPSSMRNSAISVPQGRLGVPCFGDRRQHLGHKSYHDALTHLRNKFATTLHRSDCQDLRSDQPVRSIYQSADGPVSVHHQPTQCMRTDDFSLLGSNEIPMCAYDRPLRNLARFDSCMVGLQPGLVEESQAPIANDRLLPFAKCCKHLDEQGSTVWKECAMDAGIFAQTWHQSEAEMSKRLQSGQLSAKSTSASKSEITQFSASSLASTWASGIADAIHVNPDRLSSIRGKAKSVEGKSPWASDSRWAGIMHVISHKDPRKAVVEGDISGPRGVQQGGALTNDSDHDSDADSGPAVLDCNP